MPTVAAHEAFVAFMAEYTVFLAGMCADEKEKMAALGGNVLLNVEQSIAKSQANAKQLANYEQKRAILQQAAGYGGMSFRQLIAAALPQNQAGLWELFSRFEHLVLEIRFYNEKSMAIARDKMVDIDPEAVLAPSGAANPYQKLQSRQAAGGLLETKV